MKKIIGTILLTLNILFCIVGLQILKNVSYTNLLYNNNTAVLIRADEGEEKLVSFINEKKKNEGITISKYAYIDDNNLVIYTNDVTLGQKIAIDDKMEMDDESFIANYESGSEKQIAQFYLFGAEQKITLFPMEQIRNGGTDGLYYVQYEFAEQIAQEINAGIGYAEVYDEYSINIESCFTNCSEMIIGIGMTMIILVISTIHYMIRKSKKIAILKIQGLSVIEIVRNILSELLFAQLVVLVVGVIGITVCGTVVYGIKCIGIVLKIYAVSYVISSLIYSATAVLILSLEVAFGKTVPMLKGKKPYKVVLTFHILLKEAFLIILLVGCINLVQQINYLKIEQDNLKIWDRAEDIYSIALNYVGESREAEVKLKKLYSLLEQQGGFMIDAQNYELADGENHLYDYNAPGEESYFDPYGRTITVNENYLKVNPITINGDTSLVEEKIVYDDTVRNILVPETLKKYEDEIKMRFLKDFYFQKVEVENIYNEKMEKSLNNMPIDELSVNIIYIDQGQEYFPYADIEMENGCKIIDPIVVLETGNVDYSFYMSYLSRCMFFKYEGINAFDYLLPIMEQSNTMSEIQSVASVYDSHGQEIYNLEIQRNYLITSLSVIMLLFFISSYLIISSYFQEKKYQMYINKVFGFSLLQRIYKFVLMLVMLDVGALCFVVIFRQEKSAIFLGILVILIDTILLWIEGKQLDKKNFNTIIKGEH
ncbi:MAG: DUF1430 domain-containing protein [Lachnospiraceae bacterium]|nr:DUF1430 domain-containing protein [Lachnospiraceae bacterium]